jgi:hypothetical protein
MGPNAARQHLVLRFRSDSERKPVPPALLQALIPQSAGPSTTQAQKAVLPKDFARAPSPQL